MTAHISPFAIRKLQIAKLKLLPLLLCVSVSLWRIPASAQEAPPADTAAKDMAAAATAFRDALTPEQQAQATFEFSDNERVNWHFIPKPRKGIPFKNLTDQQKPLAKALLQAGLSDRANQKAWTIMSLDLILKDIEQGKGPVRDPELYYWSLFGKPGTPDQPWGWRVEGHHLSLNFTIVKDKGVVGGPAFFGANPADVKDGPRKGLRVLAEEEDNGRAFVKSLDEAQMKKALIAASAPKDVVTGNQRTAVLQKFEGVSYADLTDAQRTALMDLVALYATRLRPELAREDLRRIASAGLPKIYFAWAGGTEKGQGHYYRIHGPTFLVEYDNTQNDANHIHSVWRDLENDFGGDLLKKHYTETKH